MGLHERADGGVQRVPVHAGERAGERRGYR
ncbi:hypothetical protein M2271_002187 [Streptomyces sp. LBL]|nr:hypothetical protein [Streptomyces sp. LBL]